MIQKFDVEHIEQKLQAGALLVDVCEAEKYAREHYCSGSVLFIITL